MIIYRLVRGWGGDGGGGGGGLRGRGLSSGIRHRNQLTAKTLQRGEIAIAESLNKVLVFA